MEVRAASHGLSVLILCSLDLNQNNMENNSLT